MNKITVVGLRVWLSLCIQTEPVAETQTSGKPNSMIRYIFFPDFSQFDHISRGFIEFTWILSSPNSPVHSGRSPFGLGAPFHLGRKAKVFTRAVFFLSYFKIGKTTNMVNNWLNHVFMSVLLRNAVCSQMPFYCFSKKKRLIVCLQVDKEESKNQENCSFTC